MRYHRINWEDRQKIEALLKAGVPIIDICEQIGVSREAMHYERRRCAGEYNAMIAQKSVGIAPNRKKAMVV